LGFIIGLSALLAYAKSIYREKEENQQRNKIEMQGIAFHLNGRNFLRFSPNKELIDYLFTNNLITSYHDEPTI
jgi:hypothetical protein